jgi:AsmA protein
MKRMGRLLKLIGLVVVAIIVLIVGATVLLTMFVDPNDYKDQITAAVEDSTGRTFSLEGDLELQVFPTLRIAVGSATLGNAPGFGNEAFAHIVGADLQVALLPLLSGQLAISQARLRGLELNLARDAQGRNNWQDLGGDAAPAAAPAAESSPTVDLNLDIASIEIIDASVTWRDAATGNDWVLDDFTMQASDFGADRAFPVSIGFTLAGDVVTAEVDADMQATISLAQNSYRLDDLDVSLLGSGSAWPGGEGRARLSFDSFVANLASETIELENLNLEMLGLTVTGTLEGTKLLSDLTLDGAIRIAEFDPRRLMAVFDTEIETADDGVLRSALANAQFHYGANEMSLRNMELGLDDSTLKGRVALVGDRFEFNLAVDDINVDRYLPPAEETPSEDEGALDEVDLPIEPLRNFDSRGRLEFAAVQFLGLHFTNAAFDLRAANGQLTLTPSASLYGGSYTGRVGLAVQGNAATLSLAQTIEGIDLAPFGRDFLDSDMISGKGRLQLDVSASGTKLGEIQRALDGDVSFSFTDGAWEGMDMFYELRRARALARRDSPPTRPEGPRRTPFSSIAASGVVEDSILTNRDLNATLAFMTVTGAGTVNLLTNEMAFDLDATFVDGPALQSAPELADLAGSQLPLNVGGTLDAPTIVPDFAALVSNRVREEVEQRVEEEKEDLQDRVRDRLRRLLE